ncbi:MAG: hypothetical protein KDC42_06030 [Ignavibacteriae bacterium]|nr:hypothetical protein [Ignavibacteriota bacterium]
MSTEQTLTLTGKSGTKYNFVIYKIGTTFNAVGAVYLFSKEKDSTHMHVYLGITGDLSERFDNHHKAKCILNNGATHICIHREDSKTTREIIEKDILEAISTKCNEI